HCPQPLSHQLNSAFSSDVEKCCVDHFPPRIDCPITDCLSLEIGSQDRFLITLVDASPFSDRLPIPVGCSIPGSKFFISCFNIIEVGFNSTERNFSLCAIPVEILIVIQIQAFTMCISGHIFLMFV